MKPRAIINVLCLISCLLIPAAYACLHVVTANAGNDQTVCVGQTVTLTASASCDQEDDGCSIVSYSWSASAGSFPNGNESASVNWTAPSTPSSTVDDITITVIAECAAEATNSDELTVTVVKVDKIQYNDPDTGWTDAGTLYVHLGTTVDFKAMPNPTGTSFPGDKPVWGGTSGASGTGPTTPVTFNTLSSSSTDYKTVTASDCGSTVTVNVIVYDFEGVRIPVDDFAGRSEDRYGIEEIVNLSCLITPSGVTASQAGGLWWWKYGVGLVYDGAQDGTAKYDAKEVQGGVALYLEVVSGPSKGDFESYWPDVIKPTGTRMTRVDPNTVRHDYGKASAGIELYYWLDPTDVSFKKLHFGEGSCDATNVSGFYLYCEPWNVYPTGNSIRGHAQNTFGAISGGNSTTGCGVENADGAWSGAADPYAAGNFTWSIPTQYIDDTATRNTFGSNQNHVSTYQANGDATQAKGGQSGSAALNDPNSDY